jgi:two-component system NtrC family sensor kinase
MDCKSALSLVDILDAMEDGIYITRDDYTVEFMNKAMIELFGQGVGKKCYEVVNDSEVLCPWCRSQEVLEKGETVHSEIYMPRLDKTYRIIEVPIKNTDGSRSKLNIYRDISLRRDQELRRMASEQEYRRLFDNVVAGVYISTKQGQFIDVNRALLNMLGYTNKEEFLKMDIQKDLYVRPEDRLTFQRMIEEEGRVVNYPVEFKRRDGTTIPVLLNSNVRTNTVGKVVGYEGICVDQTEIVRMEQRIKEAHDFLNNIILSSPNAIIGADTDGRIIIWNKGAEETFGYTVEEATQMDVRRLYPKEEMAFELMQKMRGPEHGGVGKLRSFPMSFVHKNETSVEGNLSASLIYDDQGKELASAGFFVDLSEQIRMERKLQRTQEQLLQSEKLAAMGRLTSQLAHELNNPLYGIMNTLELMKTEIAPDNKRRRLLDMSLSEVTRLADMLRKMLSFSKPDQEERRPVDINTIVEEILLLHEKQLREVDIRIAQHLAKALPQVSASKNQLRQVLLNMVSNAKDAMPDGGTLVVSTYLTGHRACIEVKDNGTGIRPEHLDKIFDTFFTTKTDSGRGVGLGLSVCYGFIRDHGGDIQVESSWGEGTTFKILLPYIQTSEQTVS